MCDKRNKQECLQCEAGYEGSCILNEYYRSMARQEEKDNEVIAWATKVTAKAFEGGPND